MAQPPGRSLHHATGRSCLLLNSPHPTPTLSAEGYGSTGPSCLPGTRRYQTLATVIPSSLIHAQIHHKTRGQVLACDIGSRRETGRVVQVGDPALATRQLRAQLPVGFRGPAAACGARHLLAEPPRHGHHAVEHREGGQLGGGGVAGGPPQGPACGC